MKDMYIDYGRNHRRDNKGKRALVIIGIIVLAGALGFGGYRIASYYLGVMNEQDASGTGPTPTSVAEAMTAEANSQTGVYGQWYAETPSSGAETTESVYERIDDDLWMADFVDTRTRVDVKGAYLAFTSFDKKLEDIIELIDTTELNAVIIDIKSDYGTIAYHMDCDVARDAGVLTVTIKDIGSLIKQLKEKNIYTIARIVTMRDPAMGEARPDLCLHLPDGTLYRDSTKSTWLNPYKDEVWDYIIDICRNCVEDGFDEVNLDYIRFSTEKNYKDIDFGPEAEGITKTEAITGGIKRVCETIKPMGAFVSCDVFGAIISSSVDAKLVGQSYFQMGQYLDYICPMIYPSHYGNGYYNLDYPDCHPYELVYHALMDSKKVLYMIDDRGNKADVRPWLQDFTASWVAHHLEYGKEEVQAQIKGVYDAGYNGWLLWNAASKYTVDALQKE